MARRGHEGCDFAGELCCTMLYYATLIEADTALQAALLSGVSSFEQSSSDSNPSNIAKSLPAI